MKRLLRHLLVALAMGSSAASAKIVEYDLTVGYLTVNFSGQSAQAIAFNGTIPGPTLRFTEGDTARIRVRNALREETSVHWHGLLVPNDQDGVPHVNRPPIMPGETQTFEFTLKQHGTYWFHSHTVLQEQRGMFGAIVVLPREPRIRADRDYVAMLSDWTDEGPDEVLRTLRRGSDYYQLKKGSVQSIAGAWRHDALGAMFKRELARMPPMDLSDVAYDRFLFNGQPEHVLDAKPGEVVRLRLVNAAAATYFYLTYAGGPLRIVAADGNDVQPVEVERFLYPIAETYDLLVPVPSDGAWELRATAQDGSGKTSLFIGSGSRHFAPDVPKPNIYQSMAGMTEMSGMPSTQEKPVAAARTGEAMAGMTMPVEKTAAASADHRGHEKMAAMPGMTMPATPKPSASADTVIPMGGMDDPARPNAPYARLRALTPTTLPGDHPVREITLRLQGDMIRFVWFLDGKTLTEADLITIRRGEIVRFVMINESMMHHPMHLHGHFFRVLNGQGESSPLKHTVDLPPMATQVIEFDANEEKEWLFHCHILYHAKVGMARIVHYEGSPPNLFLAHLDKTEHDPRFYWGEVQALSHMTEGFVTAQNNRHGLTVAWQVGWQHVEPTDYEAQLTYDRYVNSFFSVFAGAAVDRESNRGILGVRYLLPLMFQSTSWVDSKGDLRIDLTRRFRLTDRVEIFGTGEYDTRRKWESSAGVEYILGKQFSVVGRWHSEFGWGGGLYLRF